VRRPQRIGDGNAWPYLPCKTKVWISDVARFPSFSTQSVEISYSALGQRVTAPGATQTRLAALLNSAY
jgi:hypothetical protein